MTRDLLVYTCLLIAAVGTAYYAGLPEEASSEEVSWVKIDPKTVTALKYSSPEVNVSLTKQSDGKGFWVSYEELEKDGKVKEASDFRGNEKVDELLAWFNPLYAKREVGELKELDKKEFALDQAGEALQVFNGGESVVDLQIGKRAYGSRNYFVLDRSKNHVLLVSGTQIENLSKAKSRMMERDLSQIKQEELDKVEIQSGENSKTLAHTEKNGAGQTIWTEPGKKEEKPSYKNLMTKIEKLKVQSYGSAQQREALATLIPFAVVELHTRSNDTVTYRLIKQLGADGNYWVWSSALDTYAMIDQAAAENLERDIPGVVLQ